MTNHALGSNGRFHLELETNASRDAVWQVWTNVAEWRLWDKGLADAQLHGNFELGSKGIIIPNTGMNAPFHIAEFNEGCDYTITTKLIAAELHVRRSFVAGRMTTIRHDVWFSGPLSFFWAALLGPGFRKALPITMKSLINIAEEVS